MNFFVNVCDYISLNRIRETSIFSSKMIILYSSMECSLPILCVSVCVCVCVVGGLNMSACKWSEKKKPAERWMRCGQWECDRGKEKERRNEREGERGREGERRREADGRDRFAPVLVLSP